MIADLRQAAELLRAAGADSYALDVEAAARELIALRDADRAARGNGE